MAQEFTYVPIYRKHYAVILFDANSLFLVHVIEALLKCEEYVVNQRFWVDVIVYCVLVLYVVSQPSAKMKLCSFVVDNFDFLTWLYLEQKGKWKT